MSCDKTLKFVLSLVSEGYLSAEQAEALSTTTLLEDGRIDPRSATFQKALFAVPEFKEAFTKGLDEIIAKRNPEDKPVRVEIVNAQALPATKTSRR